MFVRCIVIHDQVDVQVLGDILVDVAEEGQIVLMPVATFAWATDLAGDDVECRKQGRRAVAHIVMGHSLRRSPSPWAASVGCGPVLVSASFRLHTAPRPCPAD